LTRQILFKFRESCLGPAENHPASNQEKSGRSPLHRAAAYPLQQPRGNSRAVLSFFTWQSLQNCNHYARQIFGGDHLPVEKQKIDMKTTKAVLAAMVGIGIACGAAVQLKGNLEKWSS